MICDKVIVSHKLITNIDEVFLLYKSCYKSVYSNVSSDIYWNSHSAQLNYEICMINDCMNEERTIELMQMCNKCESVIHTELKCIGIRE